jgi:CheY-like chemotaxis protein/HPt (histidine-containing phosphotransfer) domain-containing protein
MASMRNQDQPIETVKLNPKAQRELAQQVRGTGRSPDGEERRSLRVDYEVPYVDVEIFPTAALATSARFRVLPLNLSSQGLGFAHGRFVHTNSACEVLLPRLDDQMAAVRGVVVGCGHLRGMMHRVSVRFDQVVDLTQFVPLTEGQAKVLQRQREEGVLGGVDGADGRMRGRVLVVDDLEADRDLFSFWLGKGGLTVAKAADFESALKAAAAGVDVVLCDHMLGEESGVKLVEQLRAEHFRGPIIMVTADERPEIHQAAIAAGCDEVLVKPLARQQLVRAVTRRLRAAQGEGDGRIASKYAANKDWWPLLRKFVTALGSHADALAESSAAADVAQMQALCHQIKGAGGNYGYAMISDAAAGTLELLMETSPQMDAVNPAVGRLIDLLRRAESP